MKTIPAFFGRLLLYSVKAGSLTDSAKVCPSHKREDAMNSVRLLAAVMSGSLFLGLSSPSRADTIDPIYTFTVGAGTNPAHAGKWTVEVEYDTVASTVSFRVLKGPNAPGQQTWNGWTWTVEAIPGPADTVTFDALSARPTNAQGKEQGAFAQMRFYGTSFNPATGDITITGISDASGAAKYPVKVPESLPSIFGSFVLLVVLAFHRLISAACSRARPQSC